MLLHLILVYAVNVNTTEYGVVMKKLSTLCVMLFLTGCSTTSTEVAPKPEPVVEPAATAVVAEETATSLTVITTPDDARVRIMNIKPVYQDGIELDEGKYDIEVSKPGYLTYRKWVEVNKKTVLTVELDSVPATESAQ